MDLFQSIIDVVDSFFGGLSKAFDQFVEWLKDLFGLPATDSKTAE